MMFGQVFCLTANVFELCFLAGLGAQDCQPALNLNRSTKLQVCTSARLRKTRVIGSPSVRPKFISPKSAIQFVDSHLSSESINFFCVSVFFIAFSLTLGSSLFIRSKYSMGTTCQDKPYLSLHQPQELSCP